MESKDYFEKVMQDYNQNRKGRSLRKYCKDEAVDYAWLIEFKKSYPQRVREQTLSGEDAFLPISIREGHSEKALAWEVASLVLKSPQGERLEIRSTSLFVVAELLHKMSQP
ncbi:hypothetical protein [Parabacteroides sp. ZJ-118]|uniref:hypothetical protein n=1 Tax=Parabacteroides sp. ZJ-118 TaxID=2709398 RepID=UPI0013EE31B9|nr:hypothetical protein [Parabacteroides sp. ZJ-118]